MGTDPAIDQALESRARELFDQNQARVCRRTDSLFAGLMVLQWLGGIALALSVSPKTWAGSASLTHIHVYAAVILGGLIAALPVLMALAYPGRALTRHVVAAGQMLTSALLIHLSGGRIETHFHVFGSIAFLAFYRDWRVILTATIVVALDHAVRGFYWPQSVYGVLAVQPWRFVEHAGWVLFEDVFVLASIHHSLEDARLVCARQAALESNERIVEAKVKERTEQLLQAEKLSAVGQLAAGVAHEINNPLGVILGFSQSASRVVEPADALYLPIKSIEREALRCKGLVQGLLAFSRRSNGSSTEEYDLNETVQATLRIVEAQARVKAVEIVLELGSAGLLWGDKNQLQQVIVNLCNNAMDAMPGGGRLTVRTRGQAAESGRTAVIEVEDTGAGIPEGIRDKIFDPFFTTKEAGKGTGLGLSLVYEIVQKHHGTIDVKSAVGKGTVFTITLPSKNGF